MSDRTSNNYAKARVQLDRAEAELHRAFKRWSRARDRVRRYERRLDADFNRLADTIGGKLDWREIAKE